MLLTEDDCLDLEKRVASFTPLLPLEISRAKDNENNKKGAGLLKKNTTPFFGCNSDAVFRH